jgi:uncharacterized protein
LVDDLERKSARLDELVGELDSALVAFSGGADSTLLLQRCAERVVGVVVAFTAVSEFHPRSDRAARVASDLGVEHQTLEVAVLDDPAIRHNPPDRCYRCKHRIFEGLLDRARERGISTVVEGSNVDDLDEFRPGRRALTELGIRSPLIEAGLSKAQIRELSARAGLPTADRPSDTCLATRFPYHTRLTADALARVDRAERLVRAIVGDGPLRVRSHGAVARIEVAADWVPRLGEAAVFEPLRAELRRLGYQSVVVDPAGYRSGSMDGELSREERRRALEGPDPTA